MEFKARHTSLFAFPPVLEETALGAAVGIGVAVVVLPPEPGR
jgi:hypothetical protein